jgi:hypothetical protein
MFAFIPVSRTNHANKHYIPRRGYSFAAGQQAVPILLAELGELMPHYALGFIQQDNTYQPVVLTGLGGGRNLYVNHDGKWLATYVPAFLRSHPFRLLTAENKQQVLCIQDDHLVDASQGQPMFDAEGNPAKPVQDTLNFLHECEKNQRMTQSACAALNKAGVIEKWPLRMKQAEGQESIQVDGLYRVSEKTLNGLDAETFAGLRSNGALALAYAQLFSINQVSQLTERAKYQARQQTKRQQPNIEELFGDDDILSFDNI